MAERDEHVRETGRGPEQRAAVGRHARPQPRPRPHDGRCPQRRRDPFEMPRERGEAVGGDGLHEAGVLERRADPYFAVGTRHRERQATREDVPRRRRAGAEREHLPAHWNHRHARIEAGDARRRPRPGREHDEPRRDPIVADAHAHDARALALDR